MAGILLLVLAFTACTCTLAASDSGRTRICFITPSTTKNLDANTRLEDLPVMKFLIQTLTSTFAEEDKAKYEAVLFLGFDAGDHIYDTARMGSLQQAMSTAFLSANATSPDSEPVWNSLSAASAAAGVTLSPLKFDSGHSKSVVALWNTLVQEAAKPEHNCEYFYQAGDDFEMRTPGWVSKFVNALASTGNVGVTGGHASCGNAKLITESFLHKTHFNIFGYVFPAAFQNWYCDDWMYEVYQPNYLHHWHDVDTCNHNDASTGKANYVPDETGKVTLATEVPAGKQKIKEWVSSNQPPSM